MRAHCLNPMHTLLWPFCRNSILLLRPNRRILFPGNFYPFMPCTQARATVDESDENVSREEVKKKKKDKSSLSRFQAIFPGFIGKSSGVENSILKEKWWGGGESWMKKKRERGVYGVIIQPPPKKEASLSPFPAPLTFIISSNADLVWNQSRSWWGEDSVGDGRIAFKHLTWTRPFFHRLSSPFFGLVLAMLLALEKTAIGATLVAIIPHRRAKKAPIWKSPFFSSSVFACKSFPPPSRSGATG